MTTPDAVALDNEAENNTGNVVLAASVSVRGVTCWTWTISRLTKLPRCWTTPALW